MRLVMSLLCVLTLAGCGANNTTPDTVSSPATIAVETPNASLGAWSPLVPPADIIAGLRSVGYSFRGKTTVLLRSVGFEANVVKWGSSYSHMPTVYLYDGSHNHGQIARLETSAGWCEARSYPTFDQALLAFGDIIGEHLEELGKSRYVDYDGGTANWFCGKV